jgi:hypothetical protein
MILTDTAALDGARADSLAAAPFPNDLQLRHR